MDNGKFLLSTPLQKYLKWIHVLIASSLLGSLISMLFLLSLKKGVSISGSPFLLDLAIFKIFDIVITYSFYLVFITAIFYGAFTKWGFLKRRWIILKWIGALILFSLVWIGWGESINGMAALADGEFILLGAIAEYEDLLSKSIYLTIISLVIIIIIFLISIIKPFGMRNKRWKSNRKVTLIISMTVLTIFILFPIENYFSLENYRNMPIEDSNLLALEDGNYLGEKNISGFLYKVEVSVNSHVITDIQILQNRKSSYARYAEAVIPKIIKNQNANVNAITGATTTSKALMKAVENALSQ